MTIEDAIILMLIFVMMLLVYAVIALARRVESLERRDMWRQIDVASLFEWAQQMAERFDDIPLAMPVDNRTDYDPEFWWNDGRRPEES